MIYPKKLKEGDTVGLVSPSSSVSREREKQCIAVLHNLGYKVKVADNITADYAGYMAGSAESRGNWINKMFADAEVDAIFCVRGGDGCNRIMEYLDVEVIKQHPKVFVGYSDVTNLHLFLNQKCDMVTFHGPMVSSNMIDDFDEETRTSFFEMINWDGEYIFSNPAGQQIKAIKPGRASGKLIGGNLSILTAAMGTPYEADTKGKILFIEEVHEDMCHIDRMIYQLKLSGKLAEVNGIVFGQFTDCYNNKKPEYNEINIITEALNDIEIPVIYNVQSGHGNPMMTLPFGVDCTIDSKACSMTLNYGR